MEQLDFHFAKQYRVLLTEQDEQSATILYTEPVSLSALSELRRVLQRRLKLQKVNQDAFQTLLAKYYQTDSKVALQIAEDTSGQESLASLAAQIPQAQDLLASQNEAPVIRLLNAILSQAIKEHASDIHFEIDQQTLLIRFRIDGILREVLRPQRALAPLLISRIKVMAGLDIAEKRLPQDGRISIQLAGRVIDLRIAIIPCKQDERVVIRILDKQNLPLRFDTLGMSVQMVTRLEQLLIKPHGIILVTGPTGSGKTTTLYAALMQLSNQQRNIMTIEDPIEYEIAGISQTQVNPKVAMTFATGLRALLRQDPDVMMIGEIRDSETAQIAVQASLTGHLVLSTLHTNNALSAITRLLDLGVPSFLLADSLLASLAQRLVRTLCAHCKQARTISRQERTFLQISDQEQVQKIYHAVGCQHCYHSGYIGRVGIYELITFSKQARNFIHQNNQVALSQSLDESTITLKKDGIRQVLAGNTTIEEIIRVTSKEYNDHARV